MQVSVQYEYGSPYAGFWRRTLASFIDNIIQVLVIGFFAMVAAVMNPSLIDTFYEPDPDINTFVAMQVYFAGMTGLTILFYHMIFESSALQATPGKLAVGIRVTGLTGEQIGVGRAVARSWPLWIYGTFGFFSYAVGLGGGEGILNFLGIISCIVVAFTAQKQGLHDMLAGALVVRRGAQFMVVDEYAKAF